MEKSIYTRKYRQLLDILIKARKRARMTQVKLARRLAEPQSFISKYERGQRRLDVAEFLTIAKLLKADLKGIINQ